MSGFRALLWRASEAVRQIWPKSQQGYQLVAKNESSSEGAAGLPIDSLQRSRQWPASWLSHSRGQLLLTFVASIALFIIAKVLFFRGHAAPTILPQQDHMLKVVFPSSEADSELCKTVLTAGILGYTAPRVVNYDVSLDRPGKQSDREFARIRMKQEYFSRHTSVSDDDIVVLLESPYSWFQLRPEVLLKRYYRIVDEANERLRHTMGNSAVDESKIEQSIILATQDTCSGREDGEIPCFVAPDSPDSDNPNLKYLSASTVVGPIGKMRTLFHHVRARAENTDRDVSLQTILEDIFGEQEYQREAIRQRHWSFFRKSWHSIQRAFGFGRTSIDPVPGREVMRFWEEATYEYGLALDYGNELGLPVGVSSDHAGWIQWNSSSLLPSDLRSSMPPFWTPTNNELPSEKRWEDVKLLVDKRTGSIPAVITFGWDKSTHLQREEWTELWMQPYAKTLFEQALTIPRLPVASVIDTNKGVERSFWDSEVRFDRAGMKTVAGLWAKWQDMCEGERTWLPLGSA